MIIIIRKGDIYFIHNIDSNMGSEQRFNRPGIVVSNDKCNASSSVIEIVLLTSRRKKHLPTHVKVMANCPSTALCEQIQSISIERLGEKIGHVSDYEQKEINKALMVSLGLD